MSTNLYIAFPHASAASIISHTTENSSYPAENVIFGGRDLRYKTNAAVTSSNIDFDQGSGNTAQPSYILFSEMNKFTEKLVASSTLNINFSSDDNSSFTSPDTETATIDSTDLMGVNGDDYILETTFSAAERYHRVEIDTGSDSFIHVWGKVYFGTLFDFERDPSVLSNQRFSVGRSRLNTFTLEWSGVTDAKRTAFYSQVNALSATSGIFFYDKSDCIFDGFKLMHVQIESSTCRTQWKDNNTIRLELRQIL